MEENEQTQVFLKGQNVPVLLDEVLRDDDIAVVGLTPTGKRFATRKENTRAPVPDRHPFRVYLETGVTLRIVDPAYPEVEAWFLGDSPGDLTLVADDGNEYTVQRELVRSVLSATRGEEPTGDPEIDAEQTA